MEGELHVLAQEDLPLDSTVLKVGHHGAKNRHHPALPGGGHAAGRRHPAGAGNRFRHPAPEVLARLQEAGALVWRTDACGDVEIVTDGERLWARAARAGRACGD